MSEFAGNVTGTNENPVVSASRGEYFLPEDTGRSGKSLKWLLLAISAVALFVGVCLLSAHMDYVKSMPPEFEKLSASIGETMPQLSWRTKGVKYADVPFELELLEKDGQLYAIQYTSGVATDAAAVFSVANRLAGRYGQPGDFTDMALSQLTEKDLARLQKDQLLVWSWELGHVASRYNDGEQHYCVFLDLRVIRLEAEGCYRTVLYAEARPEGTRLSGQNQ